MTHSKTPAPDSLRPARWICERFGITDKGFINWVRDPALGFPEPALRIRGHRYWRVADILAFEAAQAAKAEAA